MNQNFITWREKHKEKIRTILILICVIGILFEFMSLQKYTQEISSPEFNGQNYIPNEFKNNVNTNLTNLFDSNNYINHQTKIININYNPISKSIISLINLCFYLFILSLLWKSQE